MYVIINVGSVLVRQPRLNGYSSIMMSKSGSKARLKYFIMYLSRLWISQKLERPMAVSRISSVGRTPTGSCDNTPSEKQDRFLEGFSRLLWRRLQEGFLEGALQWLLKGGRVLRRGFKKRLSRRHLEGGNTSF